MRVAPEDLLDRARRIVTRHLGASGARVYLIGSHATGTAYEFSDIDIAVDIAEGESIPPGSLPRLREAFEESTLPCRVDVVDLRDADEEFKRRVRETGIEWDLSKSA